MATAAGVTAKKTACLPANTQRWFEDFPADLLQLIFACLSVVSLSAAGDVCRDFAAMARTVRCGATVPKLPRIGHVDLHELAVCFLLPQYKLAKVHRKALALPFDEHVWTILHCALALGGGWAELAARQKKDQLVRDRKEAALAKRMQSLDNALQKHNLGSFEDWMMSLKARGADLLDCGDIVSYCTPRLNSNVPLSRVVERCLSHERLEQVKMPRRQILRDALAEKGVILAPTDVRLQLWPFSEFIARGEMGMPLSKAISRFLANLVMSNTKLGEEFVRQMTLQREGFGRFFNAYRHTQLVVNTAFKKAVDAFFEKAPLELAERARRRCNSILASNRLSMYDSPR